VFIPFLRIILKPKKHFEWTFNYKDGEYKEHRYWRPNEINRLIQAAGGDNDFDNIRRFPWFSETIKKAKQAYLGELVFE